MEYILEVKHKFHGAHKLGPNAGKCARLHGHTWEVIVRVKSTELTTDWVVDCNDLQDMVETVVKRTHDLDHNYLNDVPAFSKFSPTMERIAEVIFSTLKPMIKSPAVLESVTVNEGGASKVTVRE